MTALIKEKMNQACDILKEFDVDCWVTFVRETQVHSDPVLPFLVDADLTWHSALIISSNGRTIAIVGEYDKKSVEDIGAYDEVIGYVQGIKNHFIDTVRSLNPSSIAINYSKGSEICDGLSYGMYLTLHSYLEEIGYENRLLSAERIISALRQRKTISEVSNIREAIRETERIFRAAGDFIRPGRTEKEIADFMKREVEATRLQLAWEARICPGVFTGPDTAEAHYVPTDRKVAPGHVLNMDFGVKVNGYCADLQRTFYIRKKGEEKAPADVVTGFETLIRAIESSRQALKPGMHGHEIDRIAREIVITAGYDEFPHGLGHQVGRFAHDGTALLGPPWEKYANKPFELVEKGMVFTLEPRLTIPERGIATVEEMVVVTNEGADYLSTPQKELLLV
ncbi:MAG TPA: Xaa-Pro peptidase family protein [Acidobacteriota bacterium]|nr:Xaa-Pro peptidase family protein [Acidobacteriota bacterium]